MHAGNPIHPINTEPSCHLMVFAGGRQCMSETASAQQAQGPPVSSSNLPPGCAQLKLPGTTGLCPTQAAGNHGLTTAAAAAFHFLPLSSTPLLCHMHNLAAAPALSANPPPAPALSHLNFDSCAATRLATRLSSNSTQPSLKLLPPPAGLPAFLRSARDGLSVGAQYSRPICACGRTRWGTGGRRASKRAGGREGEGRKQW
eukprot:362234-Chlamydomonas_euryale.AAC.1